jgi:hypothetical protein
MLWVVLFFLLVSFGANWQFRFVVIAAALAIAAAGRQIRLVVQESA